MITRHGRPAGVLIGFGAEEDWFDYRLEHHPEFLNRIRKARVDIAAGRGTGLEDVPRQSSGRSNKWASIHSRERVKAS